MKIEKEIAQKVLDTVDAGLCAGVGNQKPGEMCVEAAICFAYGLPHGDNPPCVGVAVRAGKITLNDSNWSTNEARAKGMRKIAIAQLGSESIDQVEYASRLALKTIQQIVPMALRSAGSIKGNESHREKLQAAAIACEKCETLSSAMAISISASAARAARAASDAALVKAADVQLSVLIELNSPGCEFLYLTENL